MCLRSLCVLLVAIATGCHHQTTRVEARDATAPVSVTAYTVSQVDWPVTYEAVGTVHARASTIVTSKLMAYVSEVHAKLGSLVHAGQLLAVLDARDLDSAVRRAHSGRAEAMAAVPETESGISAAEADVEMARATFRRMKNLHETASISDQDFDQASSRLKSAESALKTARSRREQLNSRIAQAEEEIRSAEILLTYAEIKSPYAGIVATKPVDVGTLAAPGFPLMTIEVEGAYRLEALVDESKQITHGQTATIAIDGLGRTLQARVTEIVPAVDISSRAYTVKLDLPKIDRLRSGMFGRASFVTGRQPVTAIPEAAVQEQGQLRFVLVNDNGVARRRFITIGRKRADRVEVLSGLSAGERIVGATTTVVNDGTPVKEGS